jgi:hypothetical protein
MTAGQKGCSVLLLTAWFAFMAGVAFGRAFL